jgi:hypothetical protein
MIEALVIEHLLLFGRHAGCMLYLQIGRKRGAGKRLRKRAPAI